MPKSRYTSAIGIHTLLPLTPAKPDLKYANTANSSENINCKIIFCFGLIPALFFRIAFS